jgi:hypothetical protein
MVHRELAGTEVLNPRDLKPLIFTDFYSAPLVRILIFSQVSKQRDPASVLKRLATAIRIVHIDYVIFTWYDPEQEFDSGTGECKLRS